MLLRRLELMVGTVVPWRSRDKNLEMNAIKTKQLEVQPSSRKRRTEFISYLFEGLPTGVALQQEGLG